MTECTQVSFEFEGHFSRRVVAGFDGGTITSDAGALLLPQVDRRLGLLPRLAHCFSDFRNPVWVSHAVAKMVSQRVYALALGYEDLNDHDQLRDDPLMDLLTGKREPGAARASKSTLCRLERTPEAGAATDRYKKIRYDAASIDRLLVDKFLESRTEAPSHIVVDLDATDTPLHGQQEGRFFHGYYDHYCYLPLYIFAGDQILGVRLREANQDVARAAWKRSSASSRRSAPAGRRPRSSSARTRASAAKN